MAKLPSNKQRGNEKVLWVSANEGQSILLRYILDPGYANQTRGGKGRNSARKYLNKEVGVRLALRRDRSSPDRGFLLRSPCVFPQDSPRCLYTCGEQTEPVLHPQLTRLVGGLCVTLVAMSTNRVNTKSPERERRVFQDNESLLQVKNMHIPSMGKLKSRNKDAQCKTN